MKRIGIILLLLATTAATADVESAIKLLRKADTQSRADMYYWHFGTLPLHSHGGKDWRSWHAALWLRRAGVAH